MRGFNRVILAGNLTRDPELRYTPKGTAVAKLGLAINRAWKDEATGTMKEEVTFVDVEAWGKSAETISQYMKKGGAILIEGRLRLDSWDDKQTNQKRYQLKVVAENFQFLGGGSREGGSFEGAGAPDASRQQQRPAARPSAAQPPASDEPMPPDAEDDVPF